MSSATKWAPLTERVPNPDFEEFARDKHCSWLLMASIRRAGGVKTVAGLIWKKIVVTHEGPVISAQYARDGAYVRVSLPGRAERRMPHKEATRRGSSASVALGDRRRRVSHEPFRGWAAGY
jgi:hypothetical protein